jgi:hypothetical protein
MDLQELESECQPGLARRCVVTAPAIRPTTPTAAAAPNGHANRPVMSPAAAATSVRDQPVGRVGEAEPLGVSAHGVCAGDLAGAAGE